MPLTATCATSTLQRPGKAVQEPDLYRMAAERVIADLPFTAGPLFSFRSNSSRQTFC
jgi:hypothetical protein